MQFIRKEIAEREVEVAGVKYPAIYNFMAIAAMEEVTETAHKYSIARLMLGVPTSSDLVGCLYGMLKAAGVKLEKEDLFLSLDPDEEGKIIDQLKEIILDQSAKTKEDHPKNAKTPENSTGTT